MVSTVASKREALVCKVQKNSASIASKNPQNKYVQLIGGPRVILNSLNVNLPSKLFITGHYEIK